MRVWYSDVFMHQLKSLGTRKLGEQAHCVKFLGYPQNSSGYRTYDPVTHKVDIVHSPIFWEEACSQSSTTFKSQVDDLDDDSTSVSDSTVVSSHLEGQTPSPLEMPTPAPTPPPLPAPSSIPAPPTHPSHVRRMPQHLEPADFGAYGCRKE